MDGEGCCPDGEDDSTPSDNAGAGSGTGHGGDKLWKLGSHQYRCNPLK